MGKNDIVFIGIAGIAAYFLLSGKGKDEGGNESGGFQIPDLFGGGTPGNVFNIAAPNFTNPDTMQTKKESSAQTSYNNAISSGLTPIQIFSGGIDKGTGQPIIPAATIGKLGSTGTGRYFAPSPTQTAYKDSTKIISPINKVSGFNVTPSKGIGGFGKKLPSIPKRK